MNIHEFQAKDLLSSYGLSVPPGKVAITPQEAADIARELGSGMIAVKAQVHAGGRARAGGVAIVDSPAKVKSTAEQMLGKKLVTEQTGPVGRVTKRVYVERGIRGIRDFMIALLVDEEFGELTLIASSQGGDAVEELVHAGQLKPERLALGTGTAPTPDKIAAFAAHLGVEETSRSLFCRLVADLCRAFVELDASLIEINPLVVDETGAFHALDVKMVLDDNALYRHPDLAVLRDEDEVDKVELQAQRHQINYVPLEGDIGVAANGAGLGLATVDMVYDAGGRPANFMDIRTTARSLDVAFGFSMLLDNPSVRVILVNVHGGGMQPCDTIVDGLGIAKRRTGRSLPTVVRLAGNNAEFARSRFVSFGYPVFECGDMWTAATKAVAIARPEP
jgi:succinyl-CoA synthetase beta subunit